jgi:hypothetical protein
MTPPFSNPTDEELKTQRLNFLKECKPKRYRAMKRDGSLEEAVRSQVEAARD